MSELKTERLEQDEMVDETAESLNDSEMMEISVKEYFYMRNEIIFLNGKNTALNDLLEKIFNERIANQSTLQKEQRIMREEIRELMLQEKRSLPAMIIKDNYSVSINDNEEPMTVENLEAFLQNRIKVKEIEEGKYAILFPMHKVADSKMYEIYLIANDGSLYLSDEGSTIEELDEIFELGEPDVITNLVAILKHYGCKKAGKSFVIDCTPEDIYVKMSFLIQAISLMLNMKIFYV